MLLPYATEDMSKGRKKGAQQDYEIQLYEEGNIIERLDDDDSEFKDDSDDQDYKPGGKSKAKATTLNATRGRGRGGGVAGPSLGGPKRRRGK